MADLNSTYLEHFNVKRGFKGGVAANCVAGFVTAPLFGPVAALARCALGAPLAGLMAEVIASKKTSTHIKVGFGFAYISPMLGMFIAGIGTLFTPTRLSIDQKWNRHWENKTLMLPWGIEKTSVPACHHLVRC